VRFENSVEIAKPPEVVWAFVRDLGRAPEWQESLVSVDVHAGTEVRQFAGRRQTGRFIVTEDDPPRRLVMTSEGGSVYARATFALEPSGDGTRVDCTLELELSGAARFAGGLVKGAVQRETRANLERLKALLES
jgi:carbon monoxide dehydrogenase subunit G